VGVEVGVRIEPEHAQLLADLAAMARDGGDRTDAEAMIAAEQDGHAAGLEFGRRPRPSRCDSSRHFAQVAIAVVGRRPRIARTIEVAAIGDVDAARDERFGQARDAQRSGPRPAPR
jgi:hypothetical protein